MRTAQVLEAAGLQLLLGTARSALIYRTACVAVGVAYPLYASFKALEAHTAVQRAQQQAQWLTYWTVFGSWQMAEGLLLAATGRFPLFHQIKFAFLVWLQHPATLGARRLYHDLIRPFLQRHQAQTDQLLLHLGHYAEMPPSVQNYVRQLREMAKGLPLLSYFAQEPQEY